MEHTKIDDIINAKIDLIQKKGRGFVLDLAEIKTFSEEERTAHQARVAELLDNLRLGLDVSDGAFKELVRPLTQAIERLLDAQRGVAVEVRETLKPVDEYRLPAEGRCHVLGDTASFIDYAKRYGNTQRSLVFYSDKEAVLVLDELVERGEREIVRMPFELSEEWKAWSGVVGSTTQHKELFKFVLRHAHLLESPEMLNAMRTVRLNARVDTESDVQEDSKSIGFKIKVQAGEELVKFPKVLSLSIPVLKSDVPEANAWVNAEIGVQIDLPDDPTKQQALFTLICPKWSNLQIERIRQEAEMLRQGLPEFTVLQGVHHTFPRQIGRDDD